jgi:hypothetical protein
MKLCDFEQAYCGRQFSPSKQASSPSAKTLYSTLNMNDTLNIVFQIIASLGSLATFGVFVFLFRRDKDKQAQIDRLTGIATILDAQNETMKKQNDLLFQQVEIFRNTSLLKGNDQEALTHLREIEEKKLRLSVQPNLWTNGGGYNGSTGEFDIDLNNKGETAIIQEYINNTHDVTIQNNSFPYELEKGVNRKIMGRQSGEKHIQYCDIDIDVIYIDKLKNRYSSKIKGTGINIKVVDTKEL